MSRKKSLTQKALIGLNLLQISLLGLLLANSPILDGGVIAQLVMFSLAFLSDAKAEANNDLTLAGNFTFQDREYNNGKFERYGKFKTDGRLEFYKVQNKMIIVIDKKTPYEVVVPDICIDNRSNHPCNRTETRYSYTYKEVSVDNSTWTTEKIKFREDSVTQARFCTSFERKFVTGRGWTIEVDFVPATKYLLKFNRTEIGFSSACSYYDVDTSTTSSGKVIYTEMTWLNDSILFKRSIVLNNSLSTEIIKANYTVNLSIWGGYIFFKTKKDIQAGEVNDTAYQIYYNNQSNNISARIAFNDTMELDWVNLSAFAVGINVSISHPKLTDDVFSKISRMNESMCKVGFDMDEGSGSNFTDLCGENNNATKAGTWIWNGADGGYIDNSTLNFTGNSVFFANEATMTNYAYTNFNITDEMNFTIMQWIRQTQHITAVDGLSVFGGKSSTGKFLMLYVAIPSGAIRAYCGGGNNVGTGANYQDGKWHFVVLRGNSSTCTLTVDNYENVSIARGVFPSQDGWYIGAQGAEGRAYNGSIDDLVIFNRTLSDNELTYHYYRRAYYVSPPNVTLGAEESAPPTGTTFGTPQVLIANISPDTVYHLNTTYCNASFGNATRGYVQPYINHTAVGTLIGYTLTANLTLFNLYNFTTTVLKNNVLACGFFAENGTTNSTELNTTAITVSNTAPTNYTAITLTQGAYTDSLLTCSPSGATDIDGDSLTNYCQFANASTTLQAYSTTCTFDCNISGCDKNSVITCLAKAYDETAYGIVAGNVTTILAILPTIPILATPLNATNTNDNTPYMDWQNSTDIVGDEINYQLEISDILTFAYINYSANISGNSTTVASALSDSIYYWRVRANNTGGVSANSTKWQFMVDTTKPSISISIPTANQYLAYLNFTISGTTTDTNPNWTNISIYNLSGSLINSTINYSASWSTNLGVHQDGSYTINASAEDLALNRNSTTINVTIDTTPPSISITSPAAGYYKSNLTINATITDQSGISTVTYNITNVSGYAIVSGTLHNSSGTNFYNATFDTTTVQDGNYTITVWVNDTVGNSNSSNVSFIIDNTIPAVYFIPPTETNNSYFNRNFIAVNVSASDTNEANVTFYLFNSSHTLNSTTLAAGARGINFTNLDSNMGYWYNVTVRDLAGNSNSSETRKITLDTTNPSISFSSPINSTIYTSYYIDLNYSATDTNGISACWYSPDSGANTTLASCANTTLKINNGEHNITVYANDSANNVNSSTVYFTVLVFPNYINANTVLNSTQVDGNQTIGYYVINSSNIVINLNGSTLTRNLTGSYDGSTIFSSNGFTNVTIRDGTLNWTEFGVVRLFKWCVENRTNASTVLPDGTGVTPFFAWFINGLNISVKMLSVEATGQCITYPETGVPGAYTMLYQSFIQPGNTYIVWVTSENPAGLPPTTLHIICSPASGIYNFFVNITYNDSTNIQCLTGNVSGNFDKGECLGDNARTDNGTQSNDFILTNSEVKLINITYSGSKYFRANFSDSTSNLSVGWYLDVQVNDSFGNNLSNVNVIVTDKNSVVRGLGTTDSNGRIRLSLPEYMENSTARDWKSNYTINATYGTSTSKSLNLTGNTETALTLDIITTCGLLNVENKLYNLANNVSSAGTCFTIGADNIELDGQGHEINYSYSVAGYAVNDSGGYNYATIRNLNIVQGNSAVSDAYGIYGYGMSGSNITNNTITTNCSSCSGILINLSNNCSITHNSIEINGAGESDGISAYNTSLSQLYNNTISIKSGGFGIFIDSNSHSNNLSQNKINTSSVNSYGLVICLGSGSNILTGNRITTYRDSSYGLVISSDSNNNILTSNIITTYGNSSWGLALCTGTRGNMNTTLNMFTVNNTLIDNIINTNSIAIHMNTTAGNNISGGSISSTTEQDYVLLNVGLTNYFRNTNFTSEKKIYLCDCSAFNYNPNSTGGVWLKTTVTNTTNIRRTLVSLQTLITKYNESASATGMYSMDSLALSSRYTLKENGVPVQTLSTNSSGSLAYNVSLSEVTKTIELKYELANQGINYIYPPANISARTRTPSIIFFYNDSVSTPMNCTLYANGIFKVNNNSVPSLSNTTLTIPNAKALSFGVSYRLNISCENSVGTKYDNIRYLYIIRPGTR